MLLGVILFLWFFSSPMMVYINSIILVWQLSVAVNIEMIALRLTPMAVFSGAGRDGDMRWGVGWKVEGGKKCYCSTEPNFWGSIVAPCLELSHIKSINSCKAKSITLISSLWMNLQKNLKLLWTGPPAEERLDRFIFGKLIQLALKFFFCCVLCMPFNSMPCIQHAAFKRPII